MIIIDAYNCLHAGSSMAGPWNGLSLRELCRLVERVDRKIVLVMDGSPKPDEPRGNEFPDVTLMYSGRGVSADSVIIDMVGNSTGSRNITVVSNDRAVKSGARRGGAKTVACEAFLAGVLRRRSAMRMYWKTAEPMRKSTGESMDTDYWLHEFGFNGARGKTPPSADAPRQSADDLALENINRINMIDMEEILRRRPPPEQ